LLQARVDRTTLAPEPLAALLTMISGAHLASAGTEGAGVPLDLDI
jgi:hypothetical protein